MKAIFYAFVFCWFIAGLSSCFLSHNAQSNRASGGKHFPRERKN